MRTTKYSKDKISFSYKGASVSATGKLAKVITFSIAGLLIMWGISAIQKAMSNNNKQFLQNQKLHLIKSCKFQTDGIELRLGKLSVGLDGNDQLVLALGSRTNRSMDRTLRRRHELDRMNRIDRIFSESSHALWLNTSR